MEVKQTQKLTKITKVTLVIYCLIIAASLISFLTTSLITKNYSYLYGFLLCLGPSAIFVFVSLLFPLSQLVEAKASKATIVWCVIGYVIKYALVIGIPFIGIAYEEHFNRWVMLGTTIISPLIIIINKIIFANVVSKKPKK